MTVPSIRLKPSFSLHLRRSSPLLYGVMVDVLCITCNVGGLLKHVDVVSDEARSALIEELSSAIGRCDAAFVAIHFQECPTPIEVWAWDLLDKDH